MFSLRSIRFAQAAQVIPVISSSVLESGVTCVVIGCGRCRVELELGGAHHSVVLEVEVEVVGPVAGDLGAELDLRTRLGRPVAGLAVGVDVQVGEVATAERDQVSVGAEVGLEVGDRPAVAGHPQLQHRVLAGDQVPGESTV